MKFSLVFRQGLVLSALFVSLDSGGMAQGPGIRDLSTTAVFRELYNIKTSIRNNHSFSRSQRVFVLELMDQRPRLLYSGLFTLGEAMNAKLFPADEMREIVERRASTAIPGGVTVILRVYQWGLDLPEDKLRSKWKAREAIRDKRKRADRLDSEERTFVDFCLKSKNPVDRLVAADVLAPKEHLDASSYSYAKARVSAQQKTKDPKFRTYWSVVQRIIENRNKPK